jgi:hypothetical protein
LAPGERFAIGTAKSVISKVRNAIRQWLEFGVQAGLPIALMENLQGQHLLL